MFPPVANAFAGVGPKAGREIAQQLDDGGFERDSAMESLGYEQPERNEGRINSIDAINASFGEGLLEEIGGY